MLCYALLTEYDLGRLQSGEQIGPVELPKWAPTPEDFIRLHRDALVRKREGGRGREVEGERRRGVDIVV